MKQINIGCGNDYKEGWVNLDVDENLKIDIVFNLNKLPNKKIPFDDGFFDLVYCKDVLEHFHNPKPLLKEMNRICKVGGIIEIKVPYGELGFVNLDHKRIFFLNSFNTREDVEDVDKGNVRLVYRKLYLNESDKNTFFGLIKRFIYGSFLFIINPLIQISPTFYDGTFLRCVFPLTSIHVKFEKVEVKA